MKKLSEALQVVSQIDPKALVPGTYTGDAVDLQDYDRVLYVAQIGSIPASGVIDYQITAGTTSNGTFVAISSGSITQLADTADNQQVVVEVDVATVSALGKRYVQDALIIGVATVACATIALGKPRYSNETDLASVAQIVSV